MFAKTIVLSDAFLDMPLSARCLYFTLGMFADDDGFVNSPKGIMRQCGASEDDLKVLLLKRFLLAFDSGVIVIKHWRINNYLQKDRYVETKYRDEKATLTVDQNGAYTENQTRQELESSSMYTQDAYTQDRLGKDSIGKDRLGNEEKRATRFSPPTLEEVKAYCSENGYNIDCEYFLDYYSGNGWKAGRVPMKDWKAAVRTWERSEGRKGVKNQDGRNRGIAEGSIAGGVGTWL
jgi:hypothetical protein